MRGLMEAKKRIGIFGWGLVGPKCPDIDTFEKKLAEEGNWLSPFRGYGPSNFVVGEPDFDFERYRSWLDARFPSSRFSQLNDKMGNVVKYSIGAFIQSLEQNPGIEQVLQELGVRTHVYIGTGLGEVPVQHEESLRYDRVRRRWNAFWAAPERCAALRDHLAGRTDPAAPPAPDEHEIGSEEWYDAKGDWDRYWMEKSEDLREYLARSAEIQSEPVPPSSGQAKLGTIRHKLSRLKTLRRDWGCPDEPWTAVSPNYLWNIANISASQVSMIGRIMGPAVAPVAACASFGIALKMASDAIQLGEAEAVVVGMSDPPPHEVTISAFYNANVLSADADVSRPLTGLKGTHVSGGSCVWIVADAEAMIRRGFRPLGLEIVAIGTSSDAHHIITPSREGPQLAMREAMRDLSATDVSTWDLHATATPGDTTEVQHSIELLHSGVLFSARKGTFGHGMSVGGGWELTAQHMGAARGQLFPAPISAEDIHADVQAHNAQFVDMRGCACPAGVAGKLSMGIGGINSCVISRPWTPSDEKAS